jgi:hypothetical protein
MKPVMLHPDTWKGVATECPIKDMEWIRSLGQKTYCHLWLRWPSESNVCLPQGYNRYIVSFHLEAVDVTWLWKISSYIFAPIEVLTDSYAYDCPLPSNVIIHQFHWWHKQCELIMQWYPEKIEKKITHQFSAICRRITQSKLLITTALLENKTNSLIKLNTFKGNDADVKPGNDKLDRLYNKFYTNWYGKTIDLIDTKSLFSDISTYGNQFVNSNPWTEVYQNCALHFTNESFHFSYLENHLGSYLYPGPFITEKTFKCLIGATGFVPVGQFETYHALEEVGFKFAYDFNTDFDNDSGNITRLLSIVQLIEQLSQWKPQDIFEATRESCKYNREYILSGDFYRFCTNKNLNVINQVYKE